MNLKGETKKEIITEMVDVLHKADKLRDRDLALQDVFRREQSMSTGMQDGIALPHAKTDGVNEMAVAVGIKKEGIDFDSMDGQKTKIFILTVSPKKTSGPHIQFLAAVSSLLKDEEIRQQVINASNKDEILFLLHKRK
jgi:fructose-specific phosphotransferase system IIA component